MLSGYFYTTILSWYFLSFQSFFQQICERHFTPSKLLLRPFQFNFRTCTVCVLGRSVSTSTWKCYSTYLIQILDTRGPDKMLETWFQTWLHWYKNHTDREKNKWWGVFVALGGDLLESVTEWIRPKYISLFVLCVSSNQLPLYSFKREKHIPDQLVNFRNLTTIIQIRIHITFKVIHFF